MLRKVVGTGIALIMILAVLPVPAGAVTVPLFHGPMVAGRVVAIDTTGQAIRIGTVEVSTTPGTVIVGIDEGYPSREGTTIAFSAIRLGDLARAIGTRQPDGSLLAASIVIDHRDFHLTGRVKSIDTTNSTISVGWVNWKRKVVRSVIHYTDSTRFWQRGKRRLGRISVANLTLRSVIHVDGYGSNGGLVAKRIVVLWRGRSAK